MNKLLFKRACLAAAVGMLPLSQAALADVSLSGWINEEINYGDDGSGSEISSMAANGTTLGSRITFAGSSDLPAGLNAGFEVILEPLSAGTAFLGFGSAPGSSFVSHGDDNGDFINVLGQSLYVGGAWGKVTVGLQSMPTDNIAVLNDPSLTLWSSISPVFRGNSITFKNNSVNTGVAVGDLLTCMGLGGGIGIGIDCNGVYRQGVRYDLPTFVDGLSIAIGWANDDIYDVAGKYSTQLGRLTAALNIGYSNNAGAAAGAGLAATYTDVETFQLQGSLNDPVTGLFGTFAYQKEGGDVNFAGIASNESDAYWTKVGIKRTWNSLGPTVFAFQYGSYNDQFDATAAAAGITSSELQRFGGEVNQYIGSSLLIYGSYENLSADVTGNTAVDNADSVDIFSLGAVYFF